MARIRIPESDRGEVVQIFRLSEEDRRKIAKVLASAKPSFFLKDAASEVEQGSDLNLDAVKDILNVLQTISHTAAAADEPIKEVVDALVIAVKNFEGLEPPLTDDEIESSKAFLVETLTTGIISTTTKAQRIITQHTHTYLSSSLYSDIRSVFEANGDLGDPRVAVVVHNLKIRYSQDRRDKDFFIALDEKDLIDLKRTIDRALTKQKKLESAISRAKMTHLTPLSSSDEL